jgi:hypothetical protein
VTEGVDWLRVLIDKVEGIGRRLKGGIAEVID